MAMKNETKQKTRSVEGFLSFYAFFRQKIAKDAEKALGKYGRIITEILLTGPDLFIFIVRLYKDPEIPIDYKLALGSILIYWVVPLDFLSEMFLGVLGYVDDIFLAAYILNSLMKHIDVEKMKSYWPGCQEAPKIISKILEYSETVANLVGKNSRAKFNQLITRIESRLSTTETPKTGPQSQDSQTATPFE
jgi:uncharacterized membrane protein YkvA (DUF1232 family)